MTVMIRGLTHVYDSGSEPVVALAGLDLDLAAGSVTVVRGPNGSGKSTLVSVLRGALRPSAGTVRTHDGHPIVTATITQFQNTVADLTVEEHLSLFGVSLPLESPLTQHLATRAALLSRAAQQQLAAALIDVERAELVLADEPAASLSHHEAVRLYAELARQCRSAGRTLLLVTHDYRAEAVADRVVRLRDGRISEVWEPGGGEGQYIDARGWMRLPDSVRSRFDDRVVVANGEAVTLDGARPASENFRSETAPVPVTSDGITLDDVQVHAEPAGISAHIRRGQVTHIAGPAGSGTSALLRVIAAGAPHHAGSVTSVEPELLTEGILVSSEQPLGGRQTLADMHPDAAWVEALELRDLQHRPLDTLSGGQRQRALVCVALSQDAAVVAIDEPTVNLDPQWRDRCMDALRRAAADGRIVVVATHDEDTIGLHDAVIRMGPAGG